MRVLFYPSHFLRPQGVNGGLAYLPGERFVKSVSVDYCEKMICDYRHEHENSSTCYEVHKCRCEWCVSEHIARMEELHPERPKKWQGAEFIKEFEFLVRNGLNGTEACKALGRDKKNVIEYLNNKGRGDLVKYL